MGYRVVLRRLSDSVLLRIRAVCRALHALTDSEEVWGAMLASLVEGKYSVPARLQRPVSCPWHASSEPSTVFQDYWLMLADSTRTKFNSLDEIVGQRRGLPPGVWCFRFKAQAGRTWLQMDPWWNGLPAIRLRLKDDGTMEAASDAPGLWGRTGTPAGRYQVTEEKGRHVIRENGHPSLPLFRHPVHWGMYLQSCWTVWTAFPMAPMGEDRLMEDDALEVRGDDPTQAREIAFYNNRV